MRLGVIADVHGNEVALRAVLDDAAGCRVDRWWVLGDLVLFGPRPAETLGLLRSLPGVEMLRGNTDRYVLTGEQPAPHAPPTRRPASTWSSGTVWWRPGSGGHAASCARRACSTRSRACPASCAW